MSNIRPDNVILSSKTQGFGYVGILTTSISISGSIPDGGKKFYGSITVSPDSFSIGFYTVAGSYVASDEKYEVGNGYSVVDNALGMTTYVLGSQSGTAYTASVLINNYSGSPQVVPTQTVTILIYEFESPFN